MLKNTSPYEAMYGIKPEYKRLKVFGCLCFSFLRPYASHKLDFRPAPCTFLGYGTRQKGYKCLTSEGKIVMSRHVTFNERVFPFATIAMKNTRKVINAQKSLSPIHMCSRIEEHHDIDVTNEDAVESHELLGTQTEEMNNSTNYDFVQHQNETCNEDSNNTNSAASSTSRTQVEDQPQGHPMMTRAKHGIFKPKIYTI